jgi:hypothetical protein
MKRAPNPGEFGLRHSTEQTGDVQTFAVHRDNYDPEVIARMAAMETEPLMGYRLEVERESGFIRAFTVCREDGPRLTHNAVDGGRHSDISLHTTILAPMAPDEAHMLADLEQCAALALLGISAAGAQ